jgi:tetratricopeptide (TPR) repeat protein
MPLLRVRTIVFAAAVAGCLASGPAGAQTGTAEAQLAQAKTQFDTLNFEAAAATLDPLIASLEGQAMKDPVAAKMLPTAYELRARSRFQLGNMDGATADFRSLLRVAPGFTLSGQVSQRVGRTFEDIRKTSVGKMILNLSPADADLELDGMAFSASAGEIPMAVGSHTLSGRRSGCRSAAQTFSVVAGSTTEVVLTLERVSASLAIVTSPVGVEVVVDGVSRGRTESGVLTPQWTEPVAKLNLPPNAVSKPFLVDDLAQGSHTVEFLKDCHTKVEKRIAIDKPADFLIDPVKLEKAIASVYVDSPTPGGLVLLDGDSRGPLPLSMDDVCEGSHVVEIRSPWGRYVERLNTRAGDKITVQGVVKPSVGLLSVTGLPDGYRGTDLRLALERGFGASKSVTLFAPGAEKVQQALKGESLSPGWLAFDRWRRPMGPTASAITPAARMEIGGRLAKALDVQGVAELTARPGTDRSQFLLSLLAADSSEPDVLELNLDNPASVNAAIAELDRVPAMYRPSAGLSVADVLDVAGAVVVAVDAAAAKAGLAPGDVIAKVDGQAVADGSAFSALVAQRKAGSSLSVEIKDKSGAIRAGTLAISMAPRLVAMNDQSLLFNNLVLALRPRLAPAVNTTPDPVIRLNLAVALMRLGNWTEARAELAKVQIPAGPGVSNGTVQYLLGLCHEALGQTAEAEKAWRAAATDAESLLTEDGPAVKELAERKLAGARKM